MANLYLLRHAKSDWTDLRLSDHDRPLNERGRKAATQMGRRLASDGVMPDLVICSTARRAQETLGRVIEGGALEWRVQYEPALYGAGTTTILDIVGADAGGCASVLLVGHNPGFHDIAMMLAQEGETGLLAALRHKYPTGTFADIEFASHTLAESLPGPGKLVRFIAP